jgi:hypothetical protein
MCHEHRRAVHHRTLRSGTPFLNGEGGKSAGVDVATPGSITAAVTLWFPTSATTEPN